MLPSTLVLQPTFSDFLSQLNQFLKKFNLSTERTDIVEHSLFSIAGSDDRPMSCHFGESSQFPGYVLVYLDRQSNYKMTKFVAPLKEKLGEDFCEPLPEDWNGFKIPLDTLFKNFERITAEINAMLMMPCNLYAYQRYADQRFPMHIEVLSTYNFEFIQYGILSEKSEFVPRVLLKMFDIPTEASNKSGEMLSATHHSIRHMLDSMLKLHIPKDLAEQLVDRINKAHPAKPIHARMVSSNDLDSSFSQITVSHALLCNSLFIAKFKNVFEKMIELDRLVLEKLRLQSRTQKNSSEAHATTLENLASEFKTTANGGNIDSDENPHLRLSSALMKFALVLRSPTQSSQAVTTASDATRRAIAFFESNITAEQLGPFKKKAKAPVKDAQRDLGLIVRKKM